jgi:predicted ATPase
MGRYQNTGFLPELVLQFEELFARTHYLGPLREYPQPRYVWDGGRPVDVGQRGEYTVPALLAARAEGLTSPRRVLVKRRHEPIEKRIADWLKEWGMVHSFTVKEIAEGRKEYEVRVRKSRMSAEVPLISVGFGVSQVLPVLALCYYAPEGSTVILEQPEIHLHPSVQMGLADALIDVVNERNVQIIVESHSEHLLRRLQRRVAEERLVSEKAALYFCSLSNGESKVDRLDLDLFGSIRNWPQDFFGDEMGEVTKRTVAAMQRKGAAVG